MLQNKRLSFLSESILHGKNFFSGVYADVKAWAFPYNGTHENREGGSIVSNTPEKAANNYIGKTSIRVDAYDKATGKGLFASDYYKFIPDLLHVKILRSPVAHCRITKLDLSKAEAMPGVARIFTAERSPFHMERHIRKYTDTQHCHNNQTAQQKLRCMILRFFIHSNFPSEPILFSTLLFRMMTVYSRRLTVPDLMRFRKHIIPRRRIFSSVYALTKLFCILGSSENFPVIQKAYRERIFTLQRPREFPVLICSSVTRKPK